MATILVIENDPYINDSTCEMLELVGHTVASCSNGVEGVRSATKQPPDLILCDIWMSEMDGYEVLDAIKGNPLTACIPFIFFSASTEPNEVRRGLAMGANGYICKPFTEEELLSTINDKLTIAD